MLCLFKRANILQITPNPRVSQNRKLYLQRKHLNTLSISKSKITPLLKAVQMTYIISGDKDLLFESTRNERTVLFLSLS